MPRILKQSAALVIAGSLLASCSGGVDGPVVEGDWRSGGETAEVFGDVVFEDECLYLYQSEIDTRYPVIWPSGTTWDFDRSVIALPGGALVREGSYVHGGGGYHHLGRLGEYTTSEGVALVSSCVDNEFGEVAVFNSSGELEVRQ